MYRSCHLSRSPTLIPGLLPTAPLKSEAFSAKGSMKMKGPLGFSTRMDSCRQPNMQGQRLHEYCSGFSTRIDSCTQLEMQGQC